MKKVFTVLSAAALFAFVSCGSSNNANQTEATEVVATEVVATEVQPADSVPACCKEKGCDSTTTKCGDCKEAK